MTPHRSRATPSSKPWPAWRSVLICFIAAALLAVAFALATATGAAPLCERVATGAMVPCWSDAKIDAAVAILARRGVRADRDFVISIEVNRGKFLDARALAQYILGEGGR